MRANIVLCASCLLFASNARSVGLLDDLMRNVPQPGSRPGEVRNAVGEESNRVSRLEAENASLKRLVLQQSEKIELLESRLKQLEAKK